MGPGARGNNMGPGARGINSGQGARGINSGQGARGINSGQGARGNNMDRGARGNNMDRSALKSRLHDAIRTVGNRYNAPLSFKGLLGIRVLQMVLQLGLIAIMGYWLSEISFAPTFKGGFGFKLVAVSYAFPNLATAFALLIS